ncbi:hypothetical protein [Paraburkholderia sp. Tr-20389]|uniref:hypothetical protein n=1 Tax=Paraburkholderia sp. Tr-20389 TaxID=2703903 RepID=UPI00197E54BF|nr:hypothetical protein [Paraburkholderia sp. Tr-20389]
MENEDLASLPPLHRLLFIYTWMLADREGRFEDRPMRIKAKALPYDLSADVDSMLQDLHNTGFITRYAVDGNKYIQINTFDKHQKPHKNEVPSVIPKMAEELRPMAEVVTTNDESSFDQGNEDNEPEPQALGPDCLIDRFSDCGFSEEEKPVVIQTPEPEEKPNVASPASRSVEIAVYLRQRGIVGSNSANPNISAWGDDVRVTNEILDAALSVVASRVSSGNLARMPGPNYLMPIIADLLKPKAASPPRRRPDKFDPVEFVNRNRVSENHERPGDYIDV